MTILESLLLAHLLGDWVLQTEWQAQNKSHNWRAMLSHLVVYHIVILAVLVARFGFQYRLVYAVVVILAITHAFLDRGWTVPWLMRTLKISVKITPERWLIVMFDQSIHMLLLGLASITLSRKGLL
jgi:hypothetical protein